ncbi:hypothetical protein [Roseimicrobium sp. ORNL1]|uniref:hypothetical protein n=1 Tax=Roseimicrobium sp. ORNL1 TaxID=2711231 RepID=UPI0013E14D4A|nr:hypothetical protein [Roseimicrobium sp. ORNL1]QIF01418.1 hypothetical protein G5S37_07755 [Roseimicrobium sp. ORNL1]
MSASPSGKEAPGPGRYTLKKKKGPWYYWLIPSKHDPKNAFIANWAAWIVSLEWLAIFAYSVASPNVCGVGEPGYISAVVVPSIFGILACWGYRGVVSGHVRKIGSALLLLTNGTLFVIFVITYFVLWLRYG